MWILPDKRATGGVESSIVSPENGRGAEVAKYLATIGASSLTGEDLVAALGRRNDGASFDIDGLALLPELLQLVPEALAARIQAPLFEVPQLLNHLKCSR